MDKIKFQNCLLLFYVTTEDYEVNMYVHTKIIHLHLRTLKILQILHARKQKSSKSLFSTISTIHTICKNTLIHDFQYLSIFPY